MSLPGKQKTITVTPEQEPERIITVEPVPDTPEPLREPEREPEKIPA